MARVTNHTTRKVLTDPTAEEGTRTKGNLEEGFGLKTIPKKMVKEMLVSFFQKNGKNYGKQNSIFTMGAVNIATIIVPEGENSEQLVGKISLDIVKFMDNYIEEQLKDDCKKYYRDVILFETKMENDKLIFTW